VLGYELDVRAAERRQEHRAEQDPLAAEHVVRPELAPQLRIGDLLAHEQRRLQPPDEPERAWVADHQRQRFAVLVDEPATELLHAGDVLDHPPHPPRVWAVLTWQEPVAGPLENVQATDQWRDLRHELDRARAGADHRDALALQVVVVVPGGRVEAVTLERPVDARERRLVELSGRDDHRVRLPAPPVGSRHRPSS
jgi:hypothetical protein